jgi:hypothetical protein
VTRKYPLEPVQRVRADRADDRARALADARRTAEAAATLLRARVHAEEAHARTRSEVLGVEQRLLEAGALTAAHLAEQSAWVAAANVQRAELARQREEAAAALSGAERQAELTRRQLQLAQAEAKVIEKHHDAFRAGEQRSVLLREDEHAEEVHQARRARESSS